MTEIDTDTPLVRGDYRVVARQDVDSVYPWLDEEPDYVLWGRLIASEQTPTVDSIQDLYQEALDRGAVSAYVWFVYEHGGYALSLQTFADPWDSGPAGVIWSEHEHEFEWFEQRIREIEAHLNGSVYWLEVQEKNTWLNESGNGVKRETWEGIGGTGDVYSWDLLETANELLDEYVPREVSTS
jgi:hypothetical protein